jgi:hypothetical protein
MQSVSGKIALKIEKVENSECLFVSDSLPALPFHIAKQFLFSVYSAIPFHIYLLESIILSLAWIHLTLINLPPPKIYHF